MNNLPPEVLELIISHLDKSSLLSIRGVSRLFRQLIGFSGPTKSLLTYILPRAAPDCYYKHVDIRANAAQLIELQNLSSMLELIRQVLELHALETVPVLNSQVFKKWGAEAVFVKAIADRQFKVLWNVAYPYLMDITPYRDHPVYLQCRSIVGQFYGSLINELRSQHGLAIASHHDTRHSYLLDKVAHDALKIKDYQTLELLISKGVNPNMFIPSITDPQSWTRPTWNPLITYAQDGDDIDFLIKHGANPLYRCQSGRPQHTVLHHFAARDNVDIVRALGKYIRDINIITHKGWTALHFAVYSKSPEIWDVLIEQGANPNIKSKLMPRSPQQLREQQNRR